MEIIVEAPLNSLSFGNVTYNILRQFWRKGVDVALYPIGGGIDLNVYDKVDPKFHDWLHQSAMEANAKLSKDKPTFKMWHLNGSQTRISPKQLLLTFHELDQATASEINIAKFQTKTLFSSKFSEDLFKNHNVDCGSVSMGFDEDFVKTDKEYLSKNVVHFGLMGKFEKRKNTEKIIRLWLQKYGNNNDYQLSVCVNNPFFKPEEMQNILLNCLDGKRYTNINFLPFLNKNSEVNEFLNSIDVDLTGLSGAEGWNLPAFNATALGKWSLVVNHTSHKDWANKDNCILIEPNGTEPAYDGKFFIEDQPFNQGNIHTWDSDTVSQAMDQAVSKKGQNNPEGEKLREQFSYEKTADRLLTELESL